MGEPYHGVGCRYHNTGCEGDCDCGRWPQELTLEQARLAADCCKDACGPAFDEIAKLCGCPTWEYPGQVIRDVQGVVAERDRLRADRATLIAATRADATRIAALTEQVHEERSLAAEQQTAIQHLVEQLQVAERQRDEAMGEISRMTMRPAAEVIEAERKRIARMDEIAAERDSARAELARLIERTTR